jgi:hypothetical protein
MNKFLLVSSLVAASLVAVGCGGGGGGAGPTPATNTTAQGLWSGKTSTNRTVTGLVLSDGTYYVLYSSIGNAAIIGGVVHGTGTSTAGTFSSTDAKDFNIEGAGVVPATFSATVAAKQSLNGSINYSNGATSSFTSTYDPSFETTPLLATVAGTFTGQVASSAGVQAATITVSTTGAISGGASGCATTGTATPRTDGNAYNVSLTFGASPCLFANQTLTGIAYFDASTKRLYAATPNAARTDGVLFAGSKPALPDPAATVLVSSYVSSTSNQERALFVSEERQLRFDMARSGLTCGSVHQSGFHALVSSHTTTLTQGLNAYINQINGQYLLNKQDVKSVIESSRASDLLYYDGFANSLCPADSTIPAFRLSVSQAINTLYDSMILSLSRFSII